MFQKLPDEVNEQLSFVVLLSASCSCLQLHLSRRLPEYELRLMKTPGSHFYRQGLKKQTLPAFSHLSVQVCRHKSCKVRRRETQKWHVTDISGLEEHDTSFLTIYVTEMFSGSMGQTFIKPTLGASLRKRWGKTQTAFLFFWLNELRIEVLWRN